MLRGFRQADIRGIYIDGIDVTLRGNAELRHRRHEALPNPLIRLRNRHFSGCRRSGCARQNQRPGEFPAMHHSTTAGQPFHQFNPRCTARRHVNFRGDILK